MIEKENRIVWADLLRLIAIFMVICSHSADPFNVSPEARANPEYNFWGSIYGVFMRPCVPLFAMLTGMLLLPVKEEMGRFYHKRILRVAVPFFLWSVFYNLFPWLTGVFGVSSSVLSTMFAYAGEAPSQSFVDSFHNILLIPFNFSIYTIHLWYIYMLIGLYLFMPVFSAWLAKASTRQKKVFLALWGISLFFPYIKEFVTHNLGGVCSWNDFGILYYFSGFVGYLLLGHCLKDVKYLPSKVAVPLSLLFLVVGYAVTYYGFRNMSAQPSSTEEQIELFFLFCSPQVALMTIAWYVMVQRVTISSGLLLSALKNLTKCGLGIYMVHYFIVGLGYLAVDYMGVPVSVRIPATAFIVFVASWLIVALVHRVFPKAARWIMG